MTPMAEKVGVSEHEIAELSRRTPLGRIGQPDDVASVAVFLASDSAGWVNGEIVEINGGFFFD